MKIHILNTEFMDFFLQLIGLVIFSLGMVLKFGFEKIKPYLNDILDTVKDGIKELSKCMFIKN